MLWIHSQIRWTLELPCFVLQLPFSFVASSSVPHWPNRNVRKMLTKGECSPKLKPITKTSHNLCGSQVIPTDKLGAGCPSPWIWQNWLLATGSEGSNDSLARCSVQGVAQLSSVNLSQRWRLWQCTQLSHRPSYKRFKALRVLWVRYWLKVAVYR